MARQTKSIETEWDIWTYDVWGNSKDGYEVNDTRRQGTVRIRCKLQTYNAGTEHEFQSAELTDRQIQRIFGTRANITTDGDDVHYLVNRERDSYPIGELHCFSHESLSPPRLMRSVSEAAVS